MKKLAILFFGLFALSTSAQAITWDFAKEGHVADGGTGERSYFPNFVTGVTNGNSLPTGITITATSTVAGVVAASSPYIDEYSPINSGNEGGLGVCSIPTDNIQCGKDDNQVIGETIIMEFDTKTHISQMVLTGDHAQIRRNTVLHIDSDLEGETTYDIGCDNFGCQLPQFEDFLSLLVLDITADKISYWITDEFGRDTNAAFYLVSMVGQVPVPAAVWLFGTAMLGLFGLRRKSKIEALAA